jgi:hypothetical protein
VARYEIQDDQGRKLEIDVEGDLTPEIAEQAFTNYDALQIASAGPRGSEARRRAQANVVARENESTIADVSGGNESGTALSGAASVGRELNRFGGSGVAGLGRAASYLIDAIGGPIADQNLRPEELTAGPILERSETNPLTRAGTSIRKQGEAFYPVNPNEKAANLAGSAVGSVVGSIGLGPAAMAGYALSSGEQGLQDALAAGATPEQAIQQGLVEATTGAVTERALGVVPGLREASRGAMRGVARPTAKTIAGEAIQEPLEGALNRASARFVTGSDPNAQPLDPETLALEAAGGAVGGAFAGGAISAANARDRANRLAAIRQQRDPFNQLNQIVETAPIDSPQMALVAEASRMPRPQAPPDMSQFEGLTTEQLLSGVQQRLDLRRRALEDDYRRRLLDESAAQAIFQPPVTQDVGTPVDQFIGEQRRAQRRSNLEAGLTLPQIQPPEPVVEPVVGQYPPEGFTAGSIPSQEEQARRAQVREEAARRGQLRAQQARQESQVPQEPQPLPSQLFPAPEPVAPVGRDLRTQALAVASRQQLAQAQADARRRAQEMKSRPISTTVIDVLANENQVSQAGPLPDVVREPALPQPEVQAPQGTPLQEGANPQVAPKPFESVAFRGVGAGTGYPQDGRTFWAPSEETAKEYGSNITKATIRFESPLYSANWIDAKRKLGIPTSSTMPQVLDAAEAAGHDGIVWSHHGKPEFVKLRQQQNPPAAEPAVPPTKSGVRLRKSPLRSEPAAAPSNATLGAGAGASPTPAPALEADKSVFGVRPYKGAPTITPAVFDQVNAAVDAAIATEDPVAKQIRDLDVDAENGVKKSAGYERLSPDGQFEAVQRYRNKLYQSALKWVETGTFSFNQATIAKSVAMDVGKSGKEKMEQRVTGEEAVGESETETNLTRATTQVSPQIAPVGKTPRARQDAVAVLKEVQSRLGLTSKELVKLVAAYQNQTSDELNDREMEAYEAALPTLQKLGSLDFSVSSLIAEPLGQAQTQEAVDAWMESMGNPDILIRVVEDPNLKTPDGRNVAAQIQLVPGGVPIITINALQVGSPAEVREKIWHEILHTVWEDPAVQKAWGEVVAQLSEADVRAQLARGYSPFEATMEAAIDKASIRAANSKVRPAWQRLIDSIWQALKGAFGFETRPNDFEALMVSALRSAAGPWNGQQRNNYNQDVAAKDKAYLEAVARGDMATAQRMVDEAAKAAGYTNKLWHGTNATEDSVTSGSSVNKSALDRLSNIAVRYGIPADRALDAPGVLERLSQDASSGVRKEDAVLARQLLAETMSTYKPETRQKRLAFSVFNLPSGELELGVHLGTRQQAGTFGQAFPFWTKIESPKRLPDLGMWDWQTVIKELRKRGVIISEDEYNSVATAEVGSRNTALRELLGKHGINSIIYKNEAEGAGDSYIVLSPSQIKSADPVTYDDAGNVVLLSQRFNPQTGDIRYSVANNLYVTQPQRFQRVAEEGQTEAVVAQGQTASAIIPQSTLDEIAALEQKQDPSPVEKATLSNLKGVRQIAQVAAVADQIRQANEGKGWGNYRTLNDLPDAYKSVAAQSIMATHLRLNQWQTALKNRREKVASQITAISNRLNDLTESRLLARVSEQEADQLLKDLQSLIDLEVKKVGTSSASRTLDELNKASAAVVGLRQKQDAIAAALQAIAKEAPLADFASPEAMKAWIESRQADKTKSPLMTDEIATAIRASLKPGSGLPDRLSLIRGLMADTAAAKGQIKDLKAKVGNPKTALKQIIALKVDANSVLNQVARLDRSLEKQLIQLDGLDAAIAAMDRMQVSPQYQARVESAFRYGGFKYSGIIRYTDRPNGDQTLIGPSGKEYTVNFTPDYTVEKANLDRIGEWMGETIEAVYNPDSPTYISDPAKRTSYGNMLAFVARYMTDRRWLDESAWQDSKAVQLLSIPLLGMEKAGMLKAAWGDHLDTRFNAYRLLAGRAGGELVKRSRAIDTFGARAKNLIERTKEPLAVARRKAIESHGFNPDDAADIAIWNRKVNSWILSQNQNPGSTPVKEGDSIGEGLVATKEDLLFAEMQHKFSRELGDIYSGTEVDGATKDPNAPGLSPEEQLFGLDFSRKAMQYGYSIGRQFSEAGQEYTREWMGARAKDLAEHKRRVAEAPDGTEVPMVWDERTKVAEADIEGHVYSHIRESSTDYTPTAGKALRAAYKEVGKMIRRGTQFTTLNDIAEELAPMLSTDEVEVGATEAKEALLKALDKDVVNYNRATELVTQPSNDPTVSDLPKALAAVRSAKGALVKARGKMVAPSFFYDYSLDTDAKRAGMVQMGKQALQISEINAARNMLAAMRAKLAEYDTRIEARAQQLGRNGKKIGTWSATRELEKDLRKKFKAGELMITYKMLSRTANKLETLIKDREDALSRQRVMEEEAFKVALLNAGAGAVASTLLSAPSPIINNLTAVVLDPLRVGLMHGGIGFALTLYSKQALRGVKYVFQKGTDKILRKLGLVLPKRLREKLMDVSWELFSDMLTHRQELEDSGGVEGAEPFSSIWSRYKANPLSFGDTTRAKETAVSRAISRVLTNPFLGKGLIPASFEYLRQRFPGAGDRLVNYTNSLLEKELSDRVKLKLWLWVDGLEGSTRDQKIKSASSQTIQPDDLGLTKEELANYRTTYDSTGSLERLAIDYYLRNPNGAKGELLTPEQRDGVVFELVSLTNKEVDSTRPDITKGGAGIGAVLKSKAFLFMRYMLQLIGVQKRVFGLKGGADWKDEFGQAAAYLFLLAMTLATGAFVLPFKQAARTVIQNEPLTSPTVTQVAENPELLGKYLTAAAGGVMPMGASLVGALTSGQPLMGPITANVLENNPLVGAANNLIGAATQAYQSGDVTYPALDWARKQVWFSQPLINALLPGEAMAREAKRAVRTGAVGMEVRESGGAPAQTRSTPMTPIIRDAVAALYEGDDAKFQAAKQRALNFFTDKGLDAKEAEARFNSSISGRDPFRSVLGRNPTEEEMGAIMARATPSQRATLSRARSGFSLRKKRSGLRIRSSKRRPSRRRVRLRKPSRA